MAVIKKVESFRFPQKAMEAMIADDVLDQTVLLLDPCRVTLVILRNNEKMGKDTSRSNEHSSLRTTTQAVDLISVTFVRHIGKEGMYGKISERIFSFSITAIGKAQ